MTPGSMRDSKSSTIGGSGPDPRPTRRGVLLGVGLVGLGGALAGCSTTAVPYDANEAGVLPNGPAQAAMPSSGGMSSSPAPARSTQPARKKARKTARPKGTVLGAATDGNIAGGAIYAAAKVVVTQPASGQYRAFSAVCTHVGCLVNKVANGTIGCPCHGSQFRITDGAVAAGPAPSPLPAKRVTIVDGRVILL